MNNIRNKIITISGEPVSGKSTTVKAIKSEYEKRGYTVHIISVGTVFRELAKKEYLKMYPDRIDVNLADILADEEFAKKRNMIDGMIDGEVEKRGKEINDQERPNEVYIVDSRLAWENIPESFAIRLTVDERIAGKRVFEDKSRGKEDSYETVETAIEKTRKRKLGEIKRFKEIYGVDLTKSENYDLIVDTSYSNIEDVAEVIVNGEEAYRNGEFYPKNWASPAHFLTSQSLRETCSKSPLGYTIEEIAEGIKKTGYDSAEVVEVFENDGLKFIEDGHHRCMAALSAGKTIIPYEITHKDDEKAIEYTKYDCRDSSYRCAYDWVDLVKYYGGNIGKIKQFENFSEKDLLSFEKLKKTVKSYNDAR